MRWQNKVAQDIYIAWEKTRENIHELCNIKAFFPNPEMADKFWGHVKSTHHLIDNIFDHAFNNIAQDPKNKLEEGLESLLKGMDELRKYWVDKRDIFSHDAIILFLDSMKPIVFNDFENNLIVQNKKGLAVLSETSSNKFTKFSQITTQLTKILNIKKKEQEIVLDSSQASLSEETYQLITEELAQKMVKEFNLGSIQFIGKSSWYENCKTIQGLYKSIKNVHEKVGLPTENLGANNSLTIVINRDVLNEKNLAGMQTQWGEKGTIFIPLNCDDLEKVWIHEYTHFLDRKSAYLVHQTMEQKNLDLSSINSLSHIALQKVMSGSIIENETEKIMAQAICAAVGGTEPEKLKQKIDNTIDELIENTKLRIIIKSLPNEENSWLSLTSSQRDILLADPDINDLAGTILSQTIQLPQIAFELKDNKLISLNSQGEIIAQEDIHLQNILNTFSQATGLKNEDILSKLQSYSTNISAGLSNDLYNIIRNSGMVVYSGNKNYQEPLLFTPGSETALAAMNVENRINFKESHENRNFNVFESYYDKPLEILARMTEDLTNPLITNEEYNQWKSKQLRDEDFLNPKLEKEERMMLCATLHALAKNVGINVPYVDLEKLPCMEPKKLDLPELNENKPEEAFQYAKPKQIIAQNEDKHTILKNIEQIREKIYNPNSAKLKM